MLLSKATYCAEEHGLRIAHLKAAWIFQHHFLPRSLQTFLWDNYSALSHRVGSFKKNVEIEDHWPIRMLRSNERLRL